MNFNSSITSILIQTSIVYRNLLEKKLESFGLHSGQIFILISLWETDRQSQNDLAKKLKVSSPTINKMVKSLEKSGYVNCGSCSQDGRVVRVSLTSRGSAIRPEIEKIWAETEAVLHSNFTDPEKMILQQLMEKTFNNLVS